jgi:adenylate cyclase
VVRTFSAEELAAETGVSVDRLNWLTSIGILKPREPGRFRPGDGFRAKMIAALLDAGFTREQVEWGASEGSLNLDHVDQYVLLEPVPLSDRTFAEFSATLGPRGSLLVPAVYKVLGLPEPDPSSPISRNEEMLLEQFLQTWSLAGDDEALTRAARLIGEGTRLAALGWPELFYEQIGRPAQERFLRGEVRRYPPEVARAAALMMAVMPQLMAWLTRRYLEQVIVGGIVDGFEAVLAARGLVSEPEPEAPPAVVFADLSGYTRLTEEHGDEAALRVASSLQRRAEDVASRNGGRLVKLLGDGAMLFFSDPGRGVAAALELVRALADDPGLEAHAGVHAGPVIERDRDLFGRTVNLASRIAGTAGPGEVMVSEAVVRVVGNDGLRFEPVEEAALKGFDEPVALFRLKAGPETTGARGAPPR